MTLAELHAELSGSCSKHEQVWALIQACLTDGMADGSEIVEAVASLGFNRQYVGLTLYKGAGIDPQRCKWRRGSDGLYLLNE